MATEAPGHETRASKRSWSEPHRRRRAALGIGHVGLILGVVGLVLGGSALAIALTNGGHKGATGATGNTGPRGPPGTNGTDGKNGAPGPGAVVNETFTSNFTTMGSSCLAANNSTINFTVAGAGVVVVTASVEVAISHSTLNTSSYTLSLHEVGSSCVPALNNEVYGYVGPTYPTGPYYQTSSLAQSFPVTTAGTYGIDVIGIAYNSGGSDFSEFFYASVVGVYYPS